MTTEISMHIAAYNSGLITPNHPLFEQIQERVLAQEALDTLLDYADALEHERCEETGAYVDNQQDVADLENHVIPLAIRRYTRAKVALKRQIKNFS